MRVRTVTLGVGRWGVTVAETRPLLGDDLEALTWADLELRIRCLGEAAILAAAAVDLGYLADCRGGDVVGIGAVGSETPFGTASLASVTVDPAWARESLHAVVASLERWARDVTCMAVELRVDADDHDGRAAFEALGYDVVGATTTRYPQVHAGGVVVERHVDSWTMRKRLTSIGR